MIFRLGKSKNRVLVGLNELNRAHNDEIRKDGFGPPFINMCDLLELLQRDFSIFGEIVEEERLGLGERDFCGFGELVGLPYLN